MQSDRIIYFRSDAGRGQIISKFIPFGSANYKLMVDMAARSQSICEWLDRQFDSRLKRGQFTLIQLGDLPSPLGPLVQMGQFFKQYRRLQSIQSKISSDKSMVIPRLHSMIAEHLH